MEKTMLCVFAVMTITALGAGIPKSFADSTKELLPIGGMGKAEQVLKGGKEAVLFEHDGKGCLTHFWFGGNFEGVEDTRIRYYVDGEKMPSIDMDLYMGHGIGFNDNQAPWATKHVGKIGKRNGLFNNYRIPFGKSIRVTAPLKAEEGIWVISCAAKWCQSLKRRHSSFLLEKSLFL